MKKYNGLENDLTYLYYQERKQAIVELLKKDDFDIKYLELLVDLLKMDIGTLDKLKEMKDNGEI